EVALPDRARLVERRVIRDVDVDALVLAFDSVASAGRRAEAVAADERVLRRRRTHAAVVERGRARGVPGRRGAPAHVDVPGQAVRDERPEEVRVDRLPHGRRLRGADAVELTRGGQAPAERGARLLRVVPGGRGALEAIPRPAPRIGDGLVELRL